MKNLIKVLLFISMFLLFYYFPVSIAKYDYEWFEKLNKPAFSPSLSLVKKGWIIILIFAFISSFWAFITKTQDSKRYLIVFYFLNYVFSILYMDLFFITKDLILTTVDIFLMVITSYMLYLSMCKINKKASFLIIPVILIGMALAFFHVGIYKLN